MDKGKQVNPSVDEIEVKCGELAAFTGVLLKDSNIKIIDSPCGDFCVGNETNVVISLDIRDLCDLLDDVVIFRSLKNYDKIKKDYNK